MSLKIKSNDMVEWNLYKKIPSNHGNSELISAILISTSISIAVMLGGHLESFAKIHPLDLFLPWELICIYFRFQHFHFIGPRESELNEKDSIIKQRIKYIVHTLSLLSGEPGPWNSACLWFAITSYIQVTGYTVNLNSE